MKFQNSNWTSTGVPRKIQTYSQLAPPSRRLGESRITASTTPSATPATIAMTVSSRVATRPWSTRDENM